MICKQCNGSGKTYNPGYGEENCCRCHGTGKVEQTEQEYIQTCNTEQLAEEIYECVMTHPWHISKEVILEWLKQPHTFE